MNNAINSTLGHRAQHLSAKALHHLHDTLDVADEDETNPHEGNNARPAKSAFEGRAGCAANGLLLCIISKQAVFVALFVLLVISTPIVATANVVQVAQRDMDVTMHPSDKNIPRDERNLLSRKLADDSTCVSTSIKVVMSNPSKEFLSCDTADGKHYVVSGVPEKVVRANRNGIIGGAVELSMLAGAYLDDTTATLVMPTLGVETLEFKEQNQDVDDPNQGFRSHLSRGSTRSVTGTALIIRIVALDDAAPAASEATLSNQAFGTEPSSQWDCYDQSMTVVSQVEIWWGHTAVDGTWACNEWNPDKCNGVCTAGLVASDPISVKSHFGTCSIGQLNFEMAGDRDGNSIQIRNGKYERLDYFLIRPTITFFLTISTCFLAPGKTNPHQHTRSPSGATTVTVPMAATIDGDDVLVNAAVEELKAQFGVGHPDDLANIQMYYLPQGVIGNAYAVVGTGMSVYGDMWEGGVVMHEVGHTFGMSHSSEAGEEYGDEACIMGAGAYAEVGMHCYNGAKSWQMGWYASRSFTYNGEGGDWNGRLIGRVDYTNENDSSSFLVLKLDTVESIDYYVMFNRINSGTAESENLVMITKADESDWWSLSYLEAKLGSGESTRLANDFELTIVSIDLNANPAYADISVKKLSQWDCYDQSMTVASQVEIWWGHTAVEGAWACNEWHPDQCNGACTANVPVLAELAISTTGGSLGDWTFCSSSSQCMSGCCSGTLSGGVLACTPLGADGFDSNICTFETEDQVLFSKSGDDESEGMTIVLHQVNITAKDDGSKEIVSSSSQVTATGILAAVSLMMLSGKWL